MSGPVSVTILLVQDLCEIPARLDRWVVDMQPTAALEFSGCEQTRPDPCATINHVPAAHWLTLPGCLCCMAPTDPRLILLRALDKGAGAPPQPVDHVVIAVPAGLLTPVMRALDTLVLVTIRLSPAEGRQTVPGDAVLRCPADDMAPAERRPCRERKARPAADTLWAIDADLPETQHQQACEGAQDPLRFAGWAAQ